MNERLIELMKECGIPTKHTRVDGNGYEYYTPNYEVEKFAELIVKECAQFVEDKFDFCGDEIIIAEEVRKHFGVE